MRAFIFALLLATTCSVIAQSPHVFRRQDQPIFEVQLRHLSLRTNGSFNLFDEKAVIEKRVDPLDPTPDEMDMRTPSMFKDPRCLWCPNLVDQSITNPLERLLEQHTTSYFTRSTKASHTDLIDTCIFYTRGLNPAGPPKLSRKANHLACKYEKYTIWNLWTNANQAKQNPKYLDHYGLFEKGHMLYPLTTPEAIEEFEKAKRTRPAIKYFEEMSRAMARMCTGKIYLYTSHPKEIHIFHNQKYIMHDGKELGPTIWSTTEYPELMTHVSNLAPELITIDSMSTKDKPEAYKVKWKKPHEVDGTADYRRGLEVAGYEPYDLDSELGNTTTVIRKRALSCYDSGIDSEPDHLDFFG